MSKTIAISLALVVLFIGAGGTAAQEQSVQLPAKMPLRENWLLKSSYQMKEDGDVISTANFAPAGWCPARVPSTVLSALIRNNVYPDLRIGLNSFRIPDASDEFNQKHDLAKYSHLPDKRNPWKDPYWYRTTFTLSETARGKHVWLNFKGINYRADVWLNGSKVADHKEMVGIYRRFRFDITDHARPGKNCLAVKVYPVDHPGEPETQLQPFGAGRGYTKEIQKDVTFVMSIGYDCMPTVPDRNMGIWQDVYIDTTGPVDIRDSFVVPHLPLPKLSPATLTISADLVNVTQTPQKGVCRGVVAEAGVEFAKDVELGPGETKSIVFLPADFPQLAVDNPRLWWPKHYGPQNLYHLRLTFETDQSLSDEKNVAFGIREVSKELHKFKDDVGLRMMINGQKVFCQGGWLQPEILFDMPANRMDVEVRYLTEANLSIVTFEDLPVPCDEFLEACDRYGLMYWMSFYSSYWVQPETNLPLDRELLAQCAVDVIKRYRNHPSMVLYSCVGEGVPAKDVYLAWRKNVLALDRTRLFVPTIDVRFPVEWLKEDVPTGLHDALTFWETTPAGYYEMVRGGGKWMFNTEIGIASLPPVDNLRKFIPDLLKDSGAKPAPFPVDATWAHHDASNYIKDFDPAIRRLYGPPYNVEDYCWKAQLLSAERHRAASEAANHRMWDITSGIWEWKLNSCWPSVGWQIYDWYLKPLVSYYYYRSAFEPLHVQLSPLDGMVTVVNRRLRPEKDLDVSAKVYDSQMKVRWEKRANSDVEANTYRDVFAMPSIADLTPVYFAKLVLAQGGKPVSENFYWLSSKQSGDFSELNRLPLVKLNVEQRIEARGDNRVARVRLKNPTDQLAFFIHLAVTKGPRGEEILPVFWEDNYFSLLPKESKEVTATFAAADLGAATPLVEVGGWNIQSAFECTDLKLSVKEVQTNQPFTVTATIRNTFLDGSRIELWADNEVVDSKLFWARAGVARELAFDLKLSRPGRHRLRVGDQTVEVVVK